MRKLYVALMLTPLVGCGKTEPSAKTEAPKESQVIRKDGWIVIAPPPAVCTEKGGQITIVEHGTVTTIIRFGTGGEPYLPSVPPPARPRVPPPEGKPFPPSTPFPSSGPPEKIPPSGPSVPPILPPVVPPIPDPLPLPSPLPLPGQLPLPGTLPLPGINR